MDGKWIAYPNGQLSNFEPGYGYMIKAKMFFTISFDGTPISQPILIKGENFVCFPWQEKVDELFDKYQSKGWGIKRIGAYNGNWGS
ncbi:MAG: hypothetical protein OMM_14513 [Candidatus Magnetoglobus multicellularis str. Araruama]|uniref:Uncharacterized protein n=1 Tax=Candidatus Magnetoglobus multicellularis str. Araruama TaxID=890399 RepID=A0A1V1NS04_9BACT|nr:MAG: hypothetical protein OMM_14513 [Candidatus Magnetoglobus multicellularis str. Araruama]